ncbi:hypothetical protein NN561_012780 [Cricetulus griseus]
MSAKEKGKFEDMAKADKARYEREMKTYIPPKGETKKKFKDPNAPKRPPSAFFLFCSEYRPKIKGEHPGLSIGDVAKKLGEMWNNTAADDKQPYEKKAAKLKEKYEKLRADGAGGRGGGEDEEDKEDEDEDKEEEEDEDEEDEEEDKEEKKEEGNEETEGRFSRPLSARCSGAEEFCSTAGSAAQLTKPARLGTHGSQDTGSELEYSSVNLTKSTTGDRGIRSGEALLPRSPRNLPGARDGSIDRQTDGQQSPGFEAAPGFSSHYPGQMWFLESRSGIPKSKFGLAALLCVRGLQTAYRLPRRGVGLLRGGAGGHTDRGRGEQAASE